MSPEVRNPNVSGPGEIDARDNHTGCADGRLRLPLNGFVDGLNDLLDTRARIAPVNGGLLPVSYATFGIDNRGGELCAAQVDGDDGIHERQLTRRLSFQAEYPDLIFGQALVQKRFPIPNLKRNSRLIGQIARLPDFPRYVDGERRIERTGGVIEDENDLFAIAHHAPHFNVRGLRSRKLDFWQHSGASGQRKKELLS